MNGRLAALYPAQPINDPLAQAMREAVVSPGKRLRPALVLMVFDLFGTGGSRPIDVACAVEIVHAASLVLDDLPCMDDADERRGRPALHRRFGEAVAILAAFALLARAQCLLVEGLAATGVAPAHREWAGRRLAEIVATLCHGQRLDLELGGEEADLERLEAIHAQKTGALFVFATELGAVCARLDRGRRASLAAFARNLGLAFQVSDDLLDVTGSAATTGKTTGRDASLGRTTFVSVFGSEGARTLCNELSAAARDALAPLGVPAALLRELAEYVRTRVS